MTTTNLSIGYTYPELNRGLKGGIKLDFDMLVAYTEERYLVPIEHPDAASFAGITLEKYVGDPELEVMYNSTHMEQFLDNSNGQDGDKMGNFYRPICGFPISDFASLEFSQQDYGQIVYASANRTFHKTPGKGRFPIGIYLMTGPAKHNISGELSIELFHWIDTSVNLPRYKA
ncbi:MULTISPECIES: hypothetical protein [unclassified Bartonella]|uniref:hypothetical protein n=1 Tax=unclassified Bartonella TaxID=2645622 RepID=UPI0015FAF859|nr:MULTISPECIES: hypothetical protein [unclassified Bartonella]UXN06836.1 hypothetical protein N6A79_02165 [Bartonella sp. HY761]